ncbi:MAG: hemerythrin family protein [Treponema sp.]|nr:hemerythrin family protein [Treponema sp.]
MINFTEDLETKVPHIDEQHRELFSRINAAVELGSTAAEKAETDKTFKLLGDYIDRHFSDEEALQRKSGYPKCDWHREQHQLYVRAFQELKAEYDQNGPSLEFTLRLNKSIIDWIVKHIRYVDKELGKYIRDKG